MRTRAAIAVLALAFGTTPSLRAATLECTEGILASRVVVLAGRQLEPLLGQPVSQLRMWTYERGQRRPMPFQVDVCGADGNLLVPAIGEQPRDRLLEERSVLLFVVRDAGDRNHDALAAGISEIEIARPGDDESRWAYLARANGVVALSPRDYVAYDAQADMVHAERYTARFHQAYADYLSIADPAGQDTANLVDRWKIRVEARLLWGLLRFRRNEEDIEERVTGYIDGPIRVVRRSLLHTKVGWGVSSPEAVGYEYFYGDHYGGPSHISIPFKLSRLFGDVEVRIYLDSPDLGSFNVTTGGQRAAVAVGPSPITTAAEPGPGGSWFMLANSEVGLVHRLRLGPTLGDVTSELFYVEHDDRADPPEAVRGLNPGVGYRLTNWASVQSGQHEIWTEAYVVDPAEFDEPDSGFAMLSAPLYVAVHRASPPPGAERHGSQGPTDGLQLSAPRSKEQP